MFYYIVTIHNKEDRIKDVLDGIIKSTTTGSIICVLDGCTDNTESIIDNYISNIPIHKIQLNDVHELKSLNAAMSFIIDYMKPNDDDFFVLLQDDVVLDEPNAESLISDVYKKHNDLGYLSFRLGCSTAIGSNGVLYEYDFVESEFGHWKQLNMDHFVELPHGQFQYCELSIKSPTCIQLKTLKKTGLFDVTLAPFGHDDLDLCIRLNQMGYRNGIYSLKFSSKVEWGGTRENKNQESEYHKNYNNIVYRNKIYLGKKHSKYYQDRANGNLTLDIDFRNQILKWKNTEEYSDVIYKNFSEKTNNIDFLINHRKYIDSNKFGFGELPFHYLWLLLVNQMPQNFKFLEIGVYKGSVLSLIKLSSDKLNKAVEIFGITPLDSSGDKYLQKYDNDNYLQSIAQVYRDNSLDISSTNIIEGKSNDPLVKECISKSSFDIVYIDGSHDYEDVVNDIELAYKIINANGFLVLDDASSLLNVGKSIPFAGHADVGLAIRDTLEKNTNYKHLLACGHNRVFQKIQ